MGVPPPNPRDTLLTRSFCRRVPASPMDCRFSHRRAFGAPAETQRQRFRWGEDEQGSGRSFRRPWAETKPSGLCDDEFRPEGRVPFGTARKEPKGGIGGRPPIRKEPRALHAHSRPPPKNPWFTGEQNRCQSLLTGAHLLTPSATHGGPRPFAQVTCSSVPRLRAPGAGVQACGSALLTAHTPKCITIPGVLPGPQAPKHKYAQARRAPGGAAQPRVQDAGKRGMHPN